MPTEEEIVALSLERSSADEISRAAVRAGMVKMRADGLLKAALGITPVEEVLRNTVPQGPQCCGVTPHIVGDGYRHVSRFTLAYLP